MVLLPPFVESNQTSDNLEELHAPSPFKKYHTFIFWYVKKTGGSFNTARFLLTL
jgi:hypothetical protein